MPASAPDWLDREVVACLVQKCGTLDAAALIAYDDTGALHSLGVRVHRVMGPGPRGAIDVYIPDGDERVFWERVVEYHGCSTQSSEGEFHAQVTPKGQGGRPGLRIPKETFREILSQSLARARSTTKPKKPTYQEIADDNRVGRTWVTPIVKWAESHHKEARHAIASSETPPKFSTFVRD